jgi:demethylmenaquinone methyltransferase/2-methoxy-6-polyprenyl-1,4-benzoquinol methylase
MNSHLGGDDGPSRIGAPLPPHPTLSRFYQRDDERPGFIDGLFDASAPHYDRISRLISLGTDRAYRRRVLLESGLAPGMAMLDVACGTGLVADLAARIVGPGGRVVGLDRSPGMLREAVRRGHLQLAVQGSAEHLPFADESFDLLCMGFALRHVSDLRTTFGEFRRVLRPGGTALVLEITPPSSPLSHRLFGFYLKALVPAITRIGTFNREAQSLMTYFWHTVEHCVPGETVMDALGQAGFSRTDRRVKLGVFSEYTARKSP